MNEKYKECLFYIVCWFAVAVLHWFISGWFVNNVNQHDLTHMEIFGFLLCFSLMGLLIICYTTLNEKNEKEETMHS